MTGESNAPVLVVIGHPFKDSFSHAIAQAYAQTLAEFGLSVELIDLALHSPPLHPEAAHLRAKTGTEHLPQQTQQWVAQLGSAHHIVWVHPQWWGTYPAVLKAFIDSTVLSGNAFDWIGKLPSGLWRGKTSRVLATMDSPTWWNALWYRNAMSSALNRATMRYTGVKPLGSLVFTPVRTSTPHTREKFLERVRRTALKDAQRLVKAGLAKSERAMSEIGAV